MYGFVYLFEQVAWWWAGFLQMATIKGTGSGDFHGDY
jgi:hypothetical protein